MPVTVPVRGRRDSAQGEMRGAQGPVPFFLGKHF